MAQPFIKLEDVTFAYEGGPNILEGIELEASSGEVLGIIAPVGGGKSTLLKICAGILRPSRGRVMIGGQDFWNLSTNQRNEIRRHMGFDFQETALITNMSIFANLALPFRYHGGLAERELEEVIDRWLDRMGVRQYRELLPAALSLGLRRKVSFIRTMLTGRDFIFWDEPTWGADREFADHVRETIIQKRRDGIGIIMTAQTGAYLTKIVDRSIAIDGTRIASDIDKT